MPPWPANLSYRQIILLGLVLGLLLSVALFFSVLRQEYTYAVANFQLEARTAAGAVQQTLDCGAHDFAAARSLYLSSSYVSHEEFDDFITDQLAGNPLPGLMALEWIPYVPAEERTLFEQIARAYGLADFQITERNQAGQIVRAGERNEYYPVYYVAPHAALNYIPGYDLGSDAARRATMDKARDSGQAAVSGPVTLVQSPAEVKGSLIFLPIYDSDAQLATVAERRAHLRGFLLGIFDLNALLTGRHGSAPAATYDLYLFDPALPPAEQLIFFAPARSPGGASAATPTRQPDAGPEQLRSGIHYSQEIQVGDRSWLLVLTPGPGQIEGAFSTLPLITMAVVFAFSTLATAYVARRRQVRDILQQSEQQCRLVAENVSDIIWAADVTTMRIFFVTPSVEVMRGFTPAEVLQQHYEQILAPESVALMAAVLPQRLAAVAQGSVGPYVDELALLRRDGSLIWTETTTHFAFAPQTQRLQLYGISHDITERRRIERIQTAQFAVSRILAQSPRLEDGIVQMLESLTISIGWEGAEFWQRSPDGSRLVWGAGWSRPDQPQVADFLRQSEEFTFAPGQGLIGRTWQDNHPYWEDNLAGHPEYPRHTLGQAGGLQLAISVPVCVDEEVLGVISFHSTASRPADDWLLETLADLGRQIGQFIARKRTEIELHNERISLAQRVQERTADLRQANAELAHALSAKDEFLANMSHELRTPLNGILTLAESMQAGTYGPLNSRQQRPLALVAQSGNHLLALINDILDLSKVEAGKLDIQLEWVSAFTVCQASMLLVQEMAGKKSIQLAFSCNDSQAQLQADPRRLKQILVNLLGNAIKFTPAGGHVTLAVAVQPQAGVIEFTVQDDGIGIPPAEQGKLFQPFTQLDAGLDRHHEGTGLGLALVRRLVELHRGQVSVESTGIRGEGSRFIVAIPWEDAVPTLLPPQDGSAEPPQTENEPNLALLGSQPPPPAADAAAANPPNSLAAPRKAKILVADDNELNLLALEDYLTSAGFELSFASDGQQVLQRAQEVEPDLILMDIQMPKMSGVEATKRLRANPRFAVTPILALTALAMPGDRELCLEAGANDYISKPFLLKDLVKIINQWLERAGSTPS